MDMMTLRRTLMDKSYVPPFTKCTQTGNPLMFITNKAKNMEITVPSAQSGTPAKIAATGMNIWDEQYVAGVINSDGSVSSGERVCSKNFIPVVAGATYVMIWPRGINRGRGAYYDENFNLVQYNSDFPDEVLGTSATQYGKFTVPSGAHYLKFCTNTSYGTTYNNNLSLNFPPIDIEYHAFIGAEHSVTVPTKDIQAVSGVNVLQNNLGADMTVEFACDDPKETNLTVMTYNVQHFSGLNDDTEMQEDILDENEPSVIGFQELRSATERSDGEIAVLPSRYWNMQVGKEPLPTAIATNYGLSNVEFHFYTNQASGENKGYLTAEMKFKGKNVFLISTHLSASSDEIKVLQITELFSLVQTKETFILMGDLNTSTCVSTSSAQYINMIKQFVDAGYNVANCSEQHGFKYTWYGTSSTSTNPKEPDDNIITSADFTMSNVRIDTIKIAAAETQDKEIDHVALICELTL